MSDNDYDNIFKIIFIGDSNVGKSSLLFRYVKNTFNEYHMTTIGIDFLVKNIRFEGKSIKLQIWDKCGKEVHGGYLKVFSRYSNGVFIVYDITDRKSFENVQWWMDELDSNGPPDICRVLIGNESDLEKYRVVKTEEGESLARKYGIPFLETSAKKSINVKEMFETIIKLMNAKANGLSTNVNNNENSQPTRDKSTCQIY